MSIKRVIVSEKLPARMPNELVIGAIRHALAADLLYYLPTR
jgi:hypothetical protein